MLIVIAAIGGNVEGEIATYDIEVLELRKKFVTRIGWKIPDLPLELSGFRAIISNGKLLLCGGRQTNVAFNYQYLILKKGEQTWLSMGSMLKPRGYHSSIAMNDSIFSCGGIEPHGIFPFEHHEEFRLEDKIVRERKELPIKLRHHSATGLDQNRYMVIGGIGQVILSKVLRLRLNKEECLHSFYNLTSLYRRLKQTTMITILMKSLSTTRKRMNGLMDQNC